MRLLSGCVGADRGPEPSNGVGGVSVGAQRRCPTSREGLWSRRMMLTSDRFWYQLARPEESVVVMARRRVNMSQIGVG